MKHILLASTLLLALPGMAFAQSGQSAQQSDPLAAQASPESDTFIGPTAGTQEFTLNGTGTNDNDFETGNFGITGTYGWYTTEAMLFSVRQSINWADTENADSQFNGSTRVAADYHFDVGRLRPFIGANFGYVYGDGVDESWVLGPEAGIKYFVNSTTFLLAQTEYRFNIDDDFDEGSFTHTVGLGFTF